MSKEAMKLALKALENSVDLVREDAYQAEKLYGNYPTRQGKVNGLKVLADDHEKAITALREALAEQPAQQALDKMAENARELGLDYKPAQQEPVAIALNTGTKQGVKWLKNVEHGKHLYTSPPAQRKPLSDEQIEKLREKTFSTGNPYCPVDSKSMRKAARAIESAHNIKENT